MSNVRNGIFMCNVTYYSFVMALGLTSQKKIVATLLCATQFGLKSVLASNVAS